MIAGSVADNLGLSDRQLHLISVEICADCWFTRFRLQAATRSRRSLAAYQPDDTRKFAGDCAASSRATTHRQRAFLQT